MAILILGWAFISATQRGGFPRAQVCTTDAGSFQGNLISQTVDNVFIGEPEPDVDLAAYGPSQGDFGEVVASASEQANDSRAVFNPRNPLYFSDVDIAPPERIDVLVIQAYKFSRLSVPQQEASTAYGRPVVVLGFSSQVEESDAPEPVVEPVEIQAGSYPDAALQDELEHLRSRQRIVSIPSANVSRTFIQTSSSDRAPTVSACPASPTTNSSETTTDLSE